MLSPSEDSIFATDVTLTPIHEHTEMDFTSLQTTSSSVLMQQAHFAYPQNNTTGSNSAFSSNGSSCFDIDETMLDRGQDDVFRMLATNPEEAVAGMISPETAHTSREEAMDVSEMLGRMWAPVQTTSTAADSINSGAPPSFDLAGNVSQSANYGTHVTVSFLYIFFLISKFYFTIDPSLSPFCRNNTCIIYTLFYWGGNHKFLV